ncbi:MAG TPA: RNA-guided endonuclease TnpB family protein [Actinomycetes bacterium]|nr:RNA-guided endonuclease TnpB family protein [Actinomycetes bacterium]
MSGGWDSRGAKETVPVGRYDPVMLAHQAFRYELAPTAAQRAALANHAGAARWAWNWGLSVRQKAWQRRKQTLTAIDLHRLLNRLKRTPRYAWLYEVSKCAPQEALRDLDRAWANYFRGRKARRRVGLPRVKKRGRCPDRFRLTGAIRVEPGVVVLPRIGRVQTKEATGKFRGRILSATCRREADRWCVALTVEVIRPNPEPVAGPVVGVDLGIATFVVASDGSAIEGPRALEKGLRKLRRRSRAVSRKQRGSRNRAKAVLALARQHRHVRNQRLDALHKATTALAKAKSVIVVEDLHVAGLVRNRRLARRILDQGWGEFHRQLAYKSQWYGSRLLVAPRFYPSSKRCSGCGRVNDVLPLGARVFCCQACGLVLDRDLNAARNLAQLGEAGWVAGSSPETENACGGGGAGQADNGLVQPPPEKQERARIHARTFTSAETR